MQVLFLAVSSLYIFYLTLQGYNGDKASLGKCEQVSSFPFMFSIYIWLVDGCCCGFAIVLKLVIVSSQAVLGILLVQLCGNNVRSSSEVIDGIPTAGLRFSENF